VGADLFSFLLSFTVDMADYELERIEELRIEQALIHDEKEDIERGRDLLEQIPDKLIIEFKSVVYALLLVVVLIIVVALTWEKSRGVCLGLLLVVGAFGVVVYQPPRCFCCT